MQLVGAILCGGRSSRFGTDKAEAPVGDLTMGGRLVGVLRSGGCDPVIGVGDSCSASLGVPVVPDIWPGGGPAVAVLSALTWAQNGHVLVVPCDLPLLVAADISEIVRRVETVADDVAVVATVEGSAKHPVAAWPTAWRHEIRRSARRTMVEATQQDDGSNRLPMRWSDLLQFGEWVGVEVSAGAVSDADTPDQLADLIAGVKLSN